MPPAQSAASVLSSLLDEQEEVLDARDVLKFMTYGELRWKISTGRWQRPCKGVIVAHSGPLTDRQAMRVALLRAGPAAVLAGLTAARLDGFAGFDGEPPTAGGPIHVLLPAGTPRRGPALGLTVVTHYARVLTDLDVHPVRQPRRTRMARSLIDAAAWMPTDRGAMAVLAAGVQQRLVRVGDLREVTDRVGTLHRRKLIIQIIGDVVGGSHALSELDFTRQVIRAFRLPEPSRQVARRDARGKRRWIDVAWDSYKVVVEIDGAQHAEDPLQRWDDMERDIDLAMDGHLTLRFPAWLVRKDPAYVATRILGALRRGGYQG